MTSTLLCMLGALLLGACASDPSVHARVVEAQDRKNIGWVNKESLEDGFTEGRAPRSSHGTPIKIAKHNEPGRVCFSFETASYDRAFNSPDKWRRKTEEMLRTMKPPVGYSIRAHASLDDFGVGKPWPEPNVDLGEVRIVRINDHPSHQLYTGNKPQFHSDGRPWMSSHTWSATIELCGDLPALTDDMRYLSLASTQLDPSDNRIALWELR